jgi:hypothetical protein
MHGSMRGDWRGGHTPNQSPTLLPPPRPISYSKSPILQVVCRQLDTPGSQFPAEQRNRGGVTVLSWGVTSMDSNRCLRSAPILGTHRSEP